MAGIDLNVVPPRDEDHGKVALAYLIFLFSQFELQLVLLVFFLLLRSISRNPFYFC